LIVSPIPYYGSLGVDLSAPVNLEKASRLRTFTAILHANPGIRIIANWDDFLLPSEDLAWLATTLGEERIKIFEQGGRLGNLSHPAVQKAILDALDGSRTQFQPEHSN
jgi:hypothetical protein